MKQASILAVAVVVVSWASEAYAQAPLIQEGSRLRRRDDDPLLLPSGTVRLFLGAKGLDEDDWEPVESQGEFAVLMDFGPQQWPIRWAIDLRFGASQEEDIGGGLDAISTTWELNLGIRKVFDTRSIVRPYIGGGLAIGGATMDIEIDDDSDSGVGFWIDAGIDFRVSRVVSLGFELCFSRIPIEIAGVDTDAGGFHFGFTVGFNW